MADKNVDTVSSGVPKFPPGPYLATVVSVLVSDYMGSIDVKLLRPTGNTDTKDQLFTVKYMSPFFGSTGQEYTTANNDYNNTQKSYGMWMVPPDPGNTVVVIFIEGNPKRGYWIGCVPDEGANFSVPGIAATKYVVEGGGRLPVAEYNKKVNTQVQAPTKQLKPKHPLATILTNQGLILDDVRGITTSSARREVPSAVFGISTPGPMDKQPGAKKGLVGKGNQKVNTFVSRLGGSTFVMDDGDDKYLRKKPASEGPPEYAAAEQGEKGGNVTIPHNELVRIRTRTGHQILLHNSEDLIYIGNAGGTAWVELTSNGKIDIYAKDSISVHSENDINFTADRDINFTANGNINLNAGLNFYATAGTNYEIKAGTDGKLTAGGTSHINAGAEHRETAGVINMNGPGAATATAALKASRIPMAEPWTGHENLDPKSFTPDKTQAVANPTPPAPPAAYNKYTITTDTFEQIKPAKK